MKRLAIQNLLILTLSILTFLGCNVAQDTPKDVTSINTTNINPKKAPIVLTNNVLEQKTEQAEYGQHTDEIQEFLSNAPLGSEIYLEQKENGEWYLKVEKTFTVQKNQEETEKIEPLYGESILI